MDSKFFVFTMRDERVSEFKDKLTAENMLAYMFCKAERKQAMVNFLEDTVQTFYEQGHKEAFERYGRCDHCKGKGFEQFIFASVQEKKVTGRVSRFCYCKRGEELKSMIETYYQKNIS